MADFFLQHDVIRPLLLIARLARGRPRLRLELNAGARRAICRQPYKAHAEVVGCAALPQRRRRDREPGRAVLRVGLDCDGALLGNCLA